MGAAAAVATQSALSAEIIVETNFRVYAYTVSEHAVLLLSLFTRIDYLMPHLAVGTLTRESVNEAFEKGVTAEEVIRFLCEHAHPQMQVRPPRSLSRQPRHHGRVLEAANSLSRKLPR